MRTFAVAMLFTCLAGSLTLLPAQTPQPATNTPDTAPSDHRAGSAFSPMNYGATGDGVANDRAAVIAAIDAAIAAGGYVDGGDRLYGSNDDIQYTGVKRPWIKRLRLKNIAPAQDSQTLHFRDCEQVRFDSLYIHTGDSPGIGSREGPRGLNIDGGSGHRVRNVELTGQGMLQGDCTATYAPNSTCRR